MKARPHGLNIERSRNLRCIKSNTAPPRPVNDRVSLPDNTWVTTLRKKK